MNSYPCIQLDIAGAAAIATLDNPPANVWSKDLLLGLKNVLSDLEQRSDITCLILTGFGEKYFSAGADLQQFRDATAADAVEAMARFAATFDYLASFSGITIAAINGYALGGGLECALACDFRIVEAHSRLGLPEARVGLLPGGGGTQRLPPLVGSTWAKRIMLMGEQIDANTAMRIGLADEVVATGHAVPHALTWAEKLSLSSPAAIRACKLLINTASHSKLEEGLGRERDAFVKLFGTKDQKEGVLSFFEKRLPVWTNN